MSTYVCTYDETSLHVPVAHLQNVCNAYSIVTFSGAMGAGKTTLIQSLLGAFGVQEVVTSPTFAYVQTYYSAGGRPIHHFDLYRLHSCDEFLAAGFQEYLDDTQALCLIEWPQVIEDVLAAYAVCACHIAYAGRDARTLSLDCS